MKPRKRVEFMLRRTPSPEVVEEVVPRRAVRMKKSLLRRAGVEEPVLSPPRVTVIEPEPGVPWSVIERDVSAVLQGFQSSGEDLLPTIDIGGEELIDIEKLTDIDEWVPELQEFTTQELRILETAGEQRVFPAGVALPAGRLIPELGEESSGADLTSRIAVKQFRRAPDIAERDEDEMWFRDEEDLMEHAMAIKAMEEGGPGAFRVDKFSTLPQEEWLTLVTEALVVYLQNHMHSMEEHLQNLEQVVDTEDVVVLRDFLVGEIKRARVYAYYKVEEDIENVRAISQKEELAANLSDVRHTVIEQLYEISSNFQMTFCLKFYDNFRRIIGWVQEQMAKDLQDIREVLEWDNVQWREHLRLKVTLGHRRWSVRPVPERIAWKLNVPKPVRKALKARVRKLLKILDLRLENFEDEDMDMAGLWVAMKRAHLRVSELYYRVTGKKDNRVNEYLGYELNYPDFEYWDEPRTSTDISDEEDEWYDEQERDLDEELLRELEAKPVREKERVEELEEMAIRFAYPPDIPISTQVDETEKGWFASVVLSHVAQDVLYNLTVEYEQLCRFYGKVMEHFPYLSLANDNMLKQKAYLGAYVKKLIPRWIELETKEAEKRNLPSLSAEASKVLQALEKQIKDTYIENAYVEARKLLLNLIKTLDEDLDSGEDSSIYRNRVVSDKVLPELLSTARASVDAVRRRIQIREKGREWIVHNFDSIWSQILAAHVHVKRFNVIAIGKCDESAAERFLCYELVRLADLGLETRVVETFEQMAAREEVTEGAVQQREEKKAKETARRAARAEMLAGEKESEKADMEDAKDNKKRLRIIVLRIIHGFKNKVRNLDQFVDDAMHIMKLPFYPPAFPLLFDNWRKEAMKYLNEEATETVKKAYSRQVKKKDKLLLKSEQALLEGVKEKMKEILTDHAPLIVQFLVSCRDKLRQQFNLIDINEYHFQDALANMNAKIAFVEKYPWTAREKFAVCWQYIAALHQRLKELIFLEHEKYGPTELEKYLGNILVEATHVARGETPFELEMEHPIGPEEVGLLSPPPPEPVEEVVVLVEAKSKKKTRETAREKAERLRMEMEKEAERRKKAEEEDAKKKKKRRRKLDPETARILQEKAEAKAQKLAAEKEARRVAKEARDAKKRALEEERKKKHEKLTEEARQLKASLKGPTDKDKKGVGKSKKKKEEKKEEEEEDIHTYFANLAKKKEKATQVAAKKAQKEAERLVGVERLKAKKAEELREKVEAAKEALRKRREEQEAKGIPKKAVSEAAQRRRQAAAMVSKPSASERKPTKKKPKPKKVVVEEVPPEVKERELKKKQELKERKLRAMEALREQHEKQKAVHKNLGYPGLSSFGTFRGRNEKPPVVSSSCGHDHKGTGEEIGTHGGMLDLLKKRTDHYGVYEIGEHLIIEMTPSEEDEFNARLLMI